MQSNVFAKWIARRLRAIATLLPLLATIFVLGCAADVGDEAERVSAEQSSLTTPVYQIDSGGGAVSPFAADQFVVGGSPHSTTTAVSTSGVANAAPAAVYQSELFGNFTYTFGNLTPGASYTVRLHFAEIYFTSAGSRKFNVSVNGAQVISNLDIFATVGANKALVLDFTSNASTSGQITVQYVGVVDNAKSSGIEILSTTGGTSNQAPTIATAAAASPSAVTGTTTALSVLGADDGGEANLTYSWATTGAPPGSVTFSANGTNAAKHTTATFGAAGSYSLQATVRDAAGLSATSSVSVVVSQRLTSIGVSPATASVQTGGIQQFVASARDQFGSALATQPSFAWTVTGGGSISASGSFTAGGSAGGPFTVNASNGSVTGTASVSVTTSGGAPSAVYQIDSGGGAVSPFSADQFVAGGSSFSTTSVVSTSGVANAAPAAVYQSERFGNFSYTFGSLTPGASYTVRLHFAEIFFTAAGSRKFNVSVNGTQVLTNLDIVATVGPNKALVRDFSSNASAAGQITVQYVSVVDNAKSNGIEILSAGGGGGGNQAPTIASAAAANPSTVTGTSTALSVLGADDAGEASLAYSWATAGTPPGAVSFSANGTNAAKSTTVTFGAAGSYSLVATVRDAGGLSVTSSVNVVVSQVFSSIAVSPASVNVAASGTQQFGASARDQFGSALVSQPGFSWAASGGGSINASGLFSAGSSPGTFTITATSAGKSGNASVTVTAAGGGVTYASDFNLVESPISEGGVWKHFGLDWALVNTSGGLAYGTQTGNGGYDDSYAHLTGFPPDQAASGVIHLDAAIDRSTSHEVEILLRWSDSAHDAHGYECNLSYDGSYAQIVRWNGPLGSFTPLMQGSAPSGVHEGDTLRAQIVGSTIIMTLNGSQIASVTDSTFSSGNPGMGFWRGSPSGAFSGDYGFTRFAATSVP